MVQGRQVEAESGEGFLEAGSLAIDTWTGEWAAPQRVGGFAKVQTRQGKRKANQGRRCKLGRVSIGEQCLSHKGIIALQIVTVLEKSVYTFIFPRQFAELAKFYW
jgi:hypothetical protein